VRVSFNSTSASSFSALSSLRFSETTCGADASRPKPPSLLCRLQISDAIFVASCFDPHFLHLLVRRHLSEKISRSLLEREAASGSSSAGSLGVLPA